MYLIYKNNHINFNLNFQNKLNLIIGDSSTGKTTIVEEMSKHQSLIRTDAERIFFNPVEDVIDMIIDKFIKGKFMLVIDSDEYSTSSVIDKITSIPDDIDICIIVMGRKFSRRLPVTARDIYKLVTIQGATKNIRECEKSEYASLLMHEIKDSMFSSAISKMSN